VIAVISAALVTVHNNASRASSGDSTGFIDKLTTLRAKKSVAITRIQPALPGTEVGDVRYPDLIVFHGCELRLYTIRAIIDGFP